MAIQLQDKLYTSAQVADILGVSLRTLYRYMEDGRILSMRTASGRHRFTKDQIVDFLNAGNLVEEDVEKNETPFSSNNFDYQKNQPQRTNYQDDQYRDNPVMAKDVAKKSMPLDDEDLDNDFDFRSLSESRARAQNQNQNLKHDAFEKPMMDERVGQQASYPNPSRRFGDEEQQSDPRKPFVTQQRDIPRGSHLEPEDEFIRKESEMLEDEDEFGSVPDVAAKSSFGLDDDDFAVDDFYSNKKPGAPLRSPASGPRDARDMDFDEAPIKQPAYAAPVRGQNMYQPENREYGSQMQSGKQSGQNMAAEQTRAAKQSWEFAAPEPKAQNQAFGAQNSEESYKPAQAEPLNIRFYKSEFTDLIDLAKKIKETGSARGVDYAFTLNAGLSLHFSINPFEILHFYINPEDLQVWKSDLKLTPVREESEANIGILINTEIIFPQTKEIGGFKLLDDKLLFKDLVKFGDQDLVRRFRSKLGL
ncbi:MAG: helix-turn-helix domain-containing protein [Niabella sp.]|nr:MAG: helix-turn-helix domain-containing protein [Niabella sp.]